MKKIIIYLLTIFVLSTLISCKKFLDKKPDIKLKVPTSLNDFQALLDNSDIIVDNSTPGTDLACDDYYLAFGNYQSIAPSSQNAYIWASDIWQGGNTGDWDRPYGVIYYSNVVIEGLEDFKVYSQADEDKRNIIKGHAFFLRAISHYFLEEMFGQPFRPSTANTDLGIPLKLTANLADIAVRSNVQAVYNQIINDLVQSINFLPNTTTPRSHPSKAAAFAMLARAYLVMQDYTKAGVYADSSLKINSTLFNYNSLSSTSSNPFNTFAPPNDLVEVLYPCYVLTTANLVIRQNTTKIDSTLYNSYDSNDYRKTVFFLKNTSTIPATWSIKGGYSAVATRTFSGPAVDEMYLTRAECYARTGNKDAALVDLNALLIKRWKNNSIPAFTPVTATDAEDALRKILIERRKELIFRGIRWIDLRRLNQDPRFAITLTRVLNGLTYTLPPNDKKYTYPIPDSEIRLSGIQQNPR